MLKRTKFITTVVAGTLALGALAGCGSSTGTSGSAPTAAHPAGAKGAKVTFLTVSQTCDYCARQAEGFKSTMEGAGAKVTMVTTNFDAAEQAQQINQAISSKPDAIVLWPADASAVVPSLKRIKAAGIPVVVSTSIPSSEDTSLWNAFTGPDNNALGAASAKSLIAGLKAKGLGTKGSVIVVTGTAGAASTIGRTNGFTSTLAKEAPELKIVGSQPGNWDQTQATTAAAALFSQFENVIGVYGEADNMTAGAITAAERAGYKPGENLIAVGSDCTIDGYNNIKAGKQYATNLQDPKVDGQNVANAAIAVLDGKKVDNVVWMKTPVITSENLSECAAAVGK